MLWTFCFIFELAGHISRSGSPGRLWETLERGFTIGIAFVPRIAVYVTGACTLLSAKCVARALPRWSPLSGFTSPAGKPTDRNHRIPSMVQKMPTSKPKPKLKKMMSSTDQSRNSFEFWRLHSIVVSTAAGQK